jgi:phosphoribosylformylglycinamidine synthase subunit PurS
LSSYDVRIEVAHRPGILDPQVGVIERALPALGYGNVTSVRVGKSIRLVVDAADEGAARAEVEEMCRRLLANPVIEDYTITVFPGETPVPPSMAPETV